MGGFPQIGPRLIPQRLPAGFRTLLSSPIEELLPPIERARMKVREAIDLFIAAGNEKIAALLLEAIILKRPVGAPKTWSDEDNTKAAHAIFEEWSHNPKTTLHTACRVVSCIEPWISKQVSLDVVKRRFKAYCFGIGENHKDVERIFKENVQAKRSDLAGNVKN